MTTDRGPISAIEFHVEHPPKFALDSKFWRPRASGKSKYFFDGVACARISANAMIVKSFFEVRRKFFEINWSLAPARQL